MAPQYRAIPRPQEGGGQVTTCKTIAEVRAAALADAQADEPLTQNQADLVAAIRQPHQAQDPAA